MHILNKFAVLELCIIDFRCVKERGLSHSDAEVVIWFSSAYKGTPESQSAAKKHI